MQNQPKVGEERYKFEVDWYDQQAQIVRKYFLTYYPVDKTIDMFDIKNKRIFLKRCEYPAVTLKDLSIGALVTVYSRQLKVVDYGDVHTRHLFEQMRQRTFGIIKPAAYPHMGKIIDMIYANNFRITRLKMSRFTEK